MKHCDYGMTLDEAGLGRDQHVGCLKWAFGDDYRNLDWVDTPSVWGIRHGDLFSIEEGDNVLLTILTVGYHYLLSGACDE